MPGRRPIKIRPSHRVQTLKWAVTVIFGATGAVLVVLFVVGVASHPGLALLFLGFAIVCGLLVRLAWWAFGSRGPALTLQVADQEIALFRRRRPVDRIGRDQVALVVIEEAGPGGVSAYRIFGPDRELVGSWDTNWINKTPMRSTRAFGRFGYPWLIDDYWTVVGPVKRRSESAPPWADDVVRH